jgi:hypothetical protein
MRATATKRNCSGNHGQVSGPQLFAFCYGVSCRIAGGDIRNTSHFGKLNKEALDLPYGMLRLFIF